MVGFFPESGRLPVLMMPDSDVRAIEAPLNADVWKVEGNELKNEQVVAILEAMKLEIPVPAEAEGSVMDKVLMKPNDVVKAGRPLIIIRARKS